MIKSMTGYGSASGTSDKLGIKIELRSVNNRYPDCSIRIPRVYTALEDGMKALIQKTVTRGKVDVYVTLDASRADDTVISVNKPLAQAYVDAIGELAQFIEMKNDLTAYALSRLPDVLTVEKKQADTDQLARDVNGILAEALADYDRMRAAEGEKMHDDISARLDSIEGFVSQVEQRSPQTVRE